jgi:hypothetical protein
MKPCYVVRYRKEGRLKDAVFENETEAQEFYQKRRQYLDQAILFKAYDEPLWARLRQARFQWFFLDMSVAYPFFVFSALIVSYLLWRLR